MKTLFKVLQKQSYKFQTALPLSQCDGAVVGNLREFKTLADGSYILKIGRQWISTTSKLVAKQLQDIKWVQLPLRVSVGNVIVDDVKQMTLIYPKY